MGWGCRGYAWGGLREVLDVGAFAGCSGVEDRPLQVASSCSCWLIAGSNAAMRHHPCSRQPLGN